MTCKEAVEQMNSVDPKTQTWMAWFRLRLHLSLCRACAYYAEASKTLARAVREMAENTKVSIDVEKLNRELLLKYARIKERDE